MQQRYEPYNGAPPFQAHSETSAGGAQAIAARAPTLRERVYAHIRAQAEQGATDEEVQRALGIQVSTEVPRRRELELLGQVFDSQVRRPTAAGVQAVVWRFEEQPAVDGMRRVESLVRRLHRQLAAAEERELQFEDALAAAEQEQIATSGLLAQIVDALFADPGRSEMCGYEGALERAQKLGEKYAGEMS